MKAWMNWVLAAGVCSPLLMACGADPGPGGKGTTESPSSERPTAPGAPEEGAVHGSVHGTLLHSQTLGKDHAIYFYDLGQGDTAVRESLSMDSGEKAVLDSVHGLKSLEDLYRRLNPDAPDAPAAVLEADRLAADRAVQSAASQDTPRVREPSSVAGAGPAAVGDGALAGAEVPLTRAFAAAGDGTCSGDVLGDGWGGQWFLDNFCNTGNFRWCQKNWYSAGGTLNNTSWAGWRQMEGDFNQRGHIRVAHDACADTIWACGLGTEVVDAEYDIMPRRYELWSFGNPHLKYLSGYSNCNHLQIAVLWN